MSEFIDQLLDSDSIILVIPATYAVCYLLVAFIRRKIRKISLRRVANRLGMKFSATINERVTTEHGLSDLDQNLRAKFRNLLVGEAHGFTLAIYDEITFRRKKTDIKRTFARIDVKQYRLPLFHLTPNSMVEKLFHKRVHRIVYFEEDDRFSKAYRLQGDQSIRPFTKKDFEALKGYKDAEKGERQEILKTHHDYQDDLRNLFQEELRALCLKHGKWHIRSKNGYLYFNWSNKRLAPGLYPAFIDAVNEIILYLKQTYQEVNAPNQADVRET